MLARLNGIAGVGSAEVDHQGELLRLRLDHHEVLGSVRSALKDLGYAAEVGDEESGSTSETRWYGADTVRQLSREESGVIAQRITPPVVHAHHLDQATGKRLTAAVAEALYGCFSAHTLSAGTPTGALRDACTAAAEAAATALIGAAGARELAAKLREDLRAVEKDGGT